MDRPQLRLSLQISPGGTSQRHPPRCLALVQVVVFQSEAQQKLLQNSCSDVCIFDDDASFNFMIFPKITCPPGFCKLEGKDRETLLAKVVAVVNSGNGSTNIYSYEGNANTAVWSPKQAKGCKQTREILEYFNFFFSGGFWTRCVRFMFARSLAIQKHLGVFCSKRWSFLRRDKSRDFFSCLPGFWNRIYGFSWKAFGWWFRLVCCFLFLYLLLFQFHF